MKLCPACKIGHHGDPLRCSLCEADLSMVPSTGGGGLVGMVLEDKYELVELLGEGGMAWVYRAMHLGLERSVAIKVLKSARSDDGEAAARFEREAMAVSRLNHPHIVSVIDFGSTATGLQYLVTEYVKGQMLYRLLWEQGALPASRVYGIMHQVLAAVEEAHVAGVIHRDLKPENILVTQLNTGEDFVKVVDFGIAVLADEQRERRVAAQASFIGTPGYMAPEQINGERATARADVYALGVLVYELLTGTAPFEDDSPVVTMSRQLTSELPPLAGREGTQQFPPELDEFLARATARDPAARLATVAEFRQRFTEVLRGMGPTRLACDLCTRPIDPQTGLCNLHAPVQLVDARPLAMRPRAGRSSTEEAPTVPSEPPHHSLVPLIAGDRLVARQREAQEIGRFLLGEGALLELVGEVGIGKSTLLAGVGRAAAQLGMRVLATGPDPALAHTPWYPVRNLVGQALGCGLDPGSADALCRLAEERALDDAAAAGLTLLYGLPGPRTGLDARQRRDRIHTTAIRSMIAAAGQGTPGVCVLVDDVDTFDRASQEFFRATTRLRAWSRIKIVLASVGGIAEDAGDHPVLAVGAVGSEDVAKIIGHGADAELAPAAVVEITRSALGNPLFAAQAAALVRGGGRPTGDLAVVLERRLAQLPPGALETLQVVAALGREVPADLLARLVDAGELYLSLGLLEGLELCTVDDDRRISPANPAIAQAALGLLEPGARRALHGRILELLTAERASAFVLARHAEEAGEWERAAALREAAGDEARRLGEDEEAALLHYRRAAHIARWELLAADDSEAFLTLSYKLGSALIDSGHLLGGEVVLKELIGSAARHERLARAAHAKLVEHKRAAH